MVILWRHPVRCAMESGGDTLETVVNLLEKRWSDANADRMAAEEVEQEVVIGDGAKWKAGTK